VVGNYTADRQQSMDRYADLLVRLYRSQGQVQLMRPPAAITRLPGLPALARKYLAYIDKLLLFPLWLMLRARAFDLVHIADHGNAFYSFCCPRQRCLVTCHDLLAVRAAMGDRDAACSASAFGPWLQGLIMAGLRHSGRLLFVSQATRSDYQRLGGGPSDQHLAVIPNPLNASFSPDGSHLPVTPAERDQLPESPFLLMVGSALPRKNRDLALRLLEQLGEGSPCRLVFAGAPLTAAEERFRLSHPLGDRLISIVRPSHLLLNLLYCRAHALLFPSLAEGFGWPLIEAQACDCPVIASTTTAIPEVAGSGALYAPAHDPAAFAVHVKAVNDPIVRSRLIQNGRANLERFSLERISKAYVQFAFPT
jgi:glycosyltransferase involved in cell wall biosynthesis